MRGDSLDPKRANPFDNAIDGTRFERGAVNEHSMLRGRCLDGQ